MKKTITIEEADDLLLYEHGVAVEHLEEHRWYDDWLYVTDLGDAHWSFVVHRDGGDGEYGPWGDRTEIELTEVIEVEVVTKKWVPA